MKNVEYLGYDPKDARSILDYSQQMVGRTIREIVGVGAVEYKSNKGNLGQLIEKYFFHYDNNSDSRADFYEAGVELKLTPFKKVGKDKYSAKERLVLTMIDYMTVINEEDFYKSHLWQKSQRLLLVEYLYRKDIKETLDYKIKYATLFTPQKRDLPTIENDYKIIVSKVKAGLAHELSEGDTYYLGAATKGGSGASRRKQPNSPEPAKPRAFAFKTTYMTYVLNNYVMPDKSRADIEERIIKEQTEKDLASYITDRLRQYENMPEYLLRDRFGFSKYEKFKNFAAAMTYRMLGVSGNSAEELTKANIVVKTIRVEKDKRRIKENMSFPAINFKEFAEEEWETSTLATYLHETKFLFVIYENDEYGDLALKGCQFWNMPYNDIECEVSDVWHRMQYTVRSGDVGYYNGKKWRYNFPKKKENRICHVRPHGRDNQDTDTLPNGRKCPKQSFWLNNEYIFSQLDGKFK